jgi:hypothetical protein
MFFEFLLQVDSVLGLSAIPRTASLVEPRDLRRNYDEFKIVHRALLAPHHGFHALTGLGCKLNL